jgi:two-component system chemotaxis sensor kinase CheA
MTIDMTQFFQVFFDETEELLAEMEKLLLAVDLEAPDDEELNAIFRTAHSIKGGAATFGITDLTDITHVLETLLDLIRKGEMGLTAEHVDAFLQAKDILKMQLDGHRLHTAVDQQAVDAVRRRLQALSRASAGATKPARSSARAAPPAPGMRRFEVGLPAAAQRDVDALAAELGLLGTLVATQPPGGTATFLLDTAQDADAIIAICSFILEPSDLRITELTTLADAGSPDDCLSSTEAEQGYGFFSPLHPQQMGGSPLLAAAEQSARENAQGYGFFTPMPSPAGEAGAMDANGLREADDKQSAHRREGERTADRAGDRSADRPPAAAAAESTSIRVSIEKVDQLINLVGELVITQAMIEQRSETLDPMLHERLLNSVSQLTRNTRDLQEAVMSIRMMPMDYVFSRFPRMVRDLAGKLGKKVEFITSGAATELDKGLIERIVDPLTHLVRNSIDHGIEMPEQRQAAGKAETGRLSLSASHQGGNIIIEVSDDGGGLSRERILAKARESGLNADENMADADVWQLIFAPGFSTALEVTDISGRGVGMDVVKRNITAMGGAVDIRTASGFGTTISISLPLTLAILDGMSVRVGDEIYILPLGYVVESLQPAAADVKDISGQGQVIKVRGEYLPLIALHRIFGIIPQQTDPSRGIVVILESDGRRAALFVDDLVGQQQVVVKNLESNYRKVAGISGATILGDGGVSLIVDVSALVRSSQQPKGEFANGGARMAGQPGGISEPSH